MKRTITVSAVALLAGCFLCGAGNASLASRLVLRVSTHSGPTPLDLVLTGSIAGVPPELAAGCVVQTDYHYVTPWGLETNSRTWSTCAEGLGRAAAPQTFTQRMQLVNTGIYTFRILLKSEDRQIAGLEHDVKVYHPIELDTGLGLLER